MTTDLNAILGKLALEALKENQSNQIEQGLIDEFFDNTNANISVEDAILAGWLKRSIDNTYSFNHPSYLAIFAAQAIADWRTFLPLNELGKLDPNALNSVPIFNRNWKELIRFWLGRSEGSFEKKEDYIKHLEKTTDFINHLMTFDDGCGGFLRTQALMSAEDGIVEYLKGGKATNNNQIDSQIKKLKMLLGEDETVYRPQRYSTATGYYKQCFNLTNLQKADDYATELKYLDEEIRAIIAIANECAQDSPILWRALELGEIAKKLGEDRQDIKNEIVAFILGCILPSSNQLFNWYLEYMDSIFSKYEELCKKYPSVKERFLEIIKFLLKYAPKNEFIFWKAFYQLNKFDESDWDIVVVLHKVYPSLNELLSSEKINNIVIQLHNVLYPPIPPELRRVDIIEQINAASFGLENIEDIASYLQYIFGEAKFKELTNSVFNSLRKYVQTTNPDASSKPSPAFKFKPSSSPINLETITAYFTQKPETFEASSSSKDFFAERAALSDSSTASNPLEPEVYKKLYELRLVHYLFDGEIFNDQLDTNLQYRKNLERYRDCFKTIYYSSLLLNPQEFYDEWNNLTQSNSGVTLPSA